jgi:hypothetical protein
MKKEFYSLPRPIFPNTLPPVPDERKKIIKTGDMVPCDGIWEPGYLSFDYKWKVIPVGVREFTNKGALTIFSAEAEAPLIDDIDSTEIKSIKVEWRLIWEDTRYCDGIIPDESEYFLEEDPGKRITCKSGEACPHSGRWATLAGGQQRFAQVEMGVVMPQAAQYQREFWSPAILIPAT